MKITDRLESTTGRKIAGGFAFAVAMMFVIGAASIISLSRYTRNAEWVAHTHQVIELLATVFGDLRDAEAAQRNYVITGDSVHLQRWEHAREVTNAELRALTALIGDNRAQLTHAKELAIMVDSRFEMMRNVIVTHDNSGYAAARDLIIRGPGNTLTESIRDHIAAMDAAERRLLTERKERYDASSTFALLLIVLGSALTIILLLVALSVINRDLQERTRAEIATREAKDAAEAANRAKSDFLARMSHELRTPLNSVIGFANILIKNKSGTLSGQDLTFLQRIQANGKHLLELINDILDLSKIEAGRLELQNTNVDLIELIRETIEQVGDRRDDKPVVLRAQLPDTSKPVFTDAHRLRQVLINLIGNALKFTEAGAVTIRLVTTEDGQPDCIQVEDTGIGIPKERLAAIFEAFEQAETTTTRRYGGTGLGLAISRALCTGMGFDLHVESELGFGSTFTIDLRPARIAAQHRLRAQVERPRRTEPVPQSAGSLVDRTVLVVDDDRDSRVLITEALQDTGVTILEASSGDEGLAIARQTRPDAILLDLVMPGMAGWEVVRRLQEDPDLRGVPIVVISVVAGASRGVLLGPIGFVEKPIDRDAVVRALRPLMRNGPARVLVIDDDPDARALLRMQVQSHSGDVVEAESAEDALGVLKELTPDLVLLDLKLPGMSGTELLGLMRSDARLSSVPVVVVTSKDLTSGEFTELSKESLGVIHKGEQLEADLETILQRTIRRKV